MKSVIGRFIGVFEVILSLGVLIAFFYPTPTRDAWVGLIYGYPMIWAVRFTVLRQSTNLSAQVILSGIAFIVLCLINIVVAPYPTRGMILLYRPMWGIALMVMGTGWVRRSQSLRGVIWGTGILAGLTAIAVLTATTWEGKASRFADLTRYLPDTRSFAVWAGGFNPNEIAGAVVWLAPILFATAIRGRLNGRWRAISMSIFVALFTGLFLGQSLSGLIGLSVGMIIALTPRRLWPWMTGLVLVGILIANALIFIAPTSSAEVLADLSGRPKVTSLEHRGVMWERGVQMFRDHPLTGVGIALYRQLRAEYPTPGFENALVPHPHNEALHFATDLGVSGVLVWLMLYASAGLSLYQAWKDDRLRPWVIAVAAGLIAHAVYGLTDAIPVWDRLAFVGWWVLGLSAALEIKATLPARPDTPSSD